MTAVFTPANSGSIEQTMTAEEYDALPDNRRLELVDGVATMMASPTARHQYITTELCHRLDRQGRPRHRAIQNIEVRLDDRLRRLPDVMVVTAEAYDGERCRYLPSEVVLAVEVVSPGSETADRRKKPVEYAGAGIPFFWRIEPVPVLTVHAYRLAAGRYASAGRFEAGQKVLVEGLEWAAVPVADLED